MIRILAVGKIKENSLKELLAEYQKRLGAYDKMEIIEVNEEKIPQNNSPLDNQKAIQVESERLLSKINENDYVVLLDLQGQMVDSKTLSKKIDSIRTYNASTIDFVIGGSLGTSGELAKRSNWRWKLSDLTLPHQLARLFVLEQIYRSFKILKNEPYHK